MSRGQRNGYQRPLISVSYTESSTFSFKQLLNYPHESKWTPFLTHYFSENLVAPGIELGTSGFAASNSLDHKGGPMIQNETLFYAGNKFTLYGVLVTRVAEATRPHMASGQTAHAPTKTNKLRGP
jgi:hypothetical protein